MADRIKVAIASPGDVTPHRERVKEVFHRWNNANEHATLLPNMWEDVPPSLGAHPQKILNEQILAESELLIAIFWSRLGTSTPNSDSGTVEEIEEFVKRKGPGRVMLYFCTGDFPHDVDLDQLQKVRQFKQAMKTRGLYCEFDTIEDFDSQLYTHLDLVMKQLVSGHLPIPAPPVAANQAASAGAVLEKPIDFGLTLKDIVRGFKERMDAFDAIDGPQTIKFYRNGSHVYDSVADSLDKFLHRDTRLSEHHRATVDRMSKQLKRLAAAIPSPGADFRQYWKDGRQISDDLLTELEHIDRVKNWK